MTTRQLARKIYNELRFIDEKELTKAEFRILIIVKQILTNKV